MEYLTKPIYMDQNRGIIVWRIYFRVQAQSPNMLFCGGLACCVCVSRLFSVLTKYILYYYRCMQLHGETRQRQSQLYSLYKNWGLGLTSQLSYFWFLSNITTKLFLGLTSQLSYFWFLSNITTKLFLVFQSFHFENYVSQIFWVTFPIN